MLHNKKGQGLVEMALVLPIILVILLGIIEGGFLFAHKLEIQNATREGARMLSLGADKDTIKSNIQSGFVLIDKTKVDNPVIKVIPPDDPEDEEPLPDSKSVRVRIEYNYTPITGFIYSEGIDLTTSVTMRKE